ncbi:hypothetical protein Q5752_002667 [Cryptotrichosporon argae]
MALGGAPRCEKCGDAVYHAEQVMGPGRKIYHKLCLKCEQCGKRLDPGSLVEHDNVPYCARCHTQLFGTRDLRHANVGPAPSPSPASPARREPDLDVRRPSVPSPRPVPPPQDYYTAPDLSALGTATATGTGTPRSYPTTVHTSPAPASASLRSSVGPSAGGGGGVGGGSAGEPEPDVAVTRPDFRSERPIAVPYAGGAGALDERGLLRQGQSPRSKVGEKVVVEDACAGCGRRVYQAEQVMAIQQKWHRWCLKCERCKTTVDPAKVSDRDGRPWCNACYAREHGPGGIAGKR